MRLFISYSRKNKDWVYWFADRLRATHGYQVWIDRDIRIGQDWWQTILSEIENSDGFLIVLSEGSVASSYCMEELAYAHELNKKIIPLLLESCEIPKIINDKRIQFYTIADSSDMNKVMSDVKSQLDAIQTVEQAKPIPRPRPAEPDLDAPEGYEQAVIAIEQENFVVAERLLKQVLESNPGSLLKRLTEEKLSLIRPRAKEKNAEIQRQESYMEVVQLAKNEITLNDARKAWQWFVAEHGKDYDPLKIFETYLHDGYREALELIKLTKRTYREKLDLVGLNLTVLPSGISQLPNLVHLDLSMNKLQTLPPEIGHLQKLKSLNLDKNQLKSIPFEIGTLPKLVSFFITEGNPLTNIPGDVVAKGDDFVLQWLREQAKANGLI